MSTPIACSLDQAARAQRATDWHAVAARVVSRDDIDGGVRLGLAGDAPLGAIAELAAAEQACCPFFAFSLTLDGRGAALEVRAPAEGLPMVQALFGATP